MDDVVGSFLRWDAISVFNSATSGVASSSGSKSFSNELDVDGLHHAEVLVTVMS